MTANKEKSVCDYNEFRRLRYFHGMLLDDKDFLAEQSYHAGKRRFLNRMLHGSGVVCGLGLESEKNAQWVKVTSGLALDCCGNEIWVNKDLRLDLTKLLPPKDKHDEKCKDPDVPNSDNKRYYLGIRYDEKGTDPVSVYLPGGGCEERTCENSRVKEGYCIEIVECCTKKDTDGLLNKFCDDKSPNKEFPSCLDVDGLNDIQKHLCSLLEEFCGAPVPCSECEHCDTPCHVILGQIEVDKDGHIQNLCLNECRQYVYTGKMFQHMIVRTLAGFEKHLKLTVSSGTVEPPDFGEMARNPISALCWYLRYFVVQRASVSIEACPDVFPKAEPSKSVSLEQMNAAIDAAVKKVNEQSKEMINKEVERRIAEIRNPPDRVDGGAR